MKNENEKKIYIKTKWIKIKLICKFLHCTHSMLFYYDKKAMFPLCIAYPCQRVWVLAFDIIL